MFEKFWQKKTARTYKKITGKPSEIQTWYNKEGQLHREDGPAYIDPNKSEKWYKNGKLHREDGPAKVIFNPHNFTGQTNINGYWGKEVWFIDGEPHREDGPAVILGNGIKKWIKNGQLHREDGPAIEYPDGGKEFWINGHLHRENGPAIDTQTIEAWYNNGKLDRKDGPALLMHSGKVQLGNSWRRQAQKFGILIPACREGEQQWWKEGKLHRENGPAIICPDGTEKWCYNGLYHKEDGPSVLYPNGSKEWWRNGRLHNEDGPAVIVQKGYFIHHWGPQGIEAYSWKDNKEKQFLLLRMNAEELPLSDLEKTHTCITISEGKEEHRENYVYKDRGESHFNNEFWIKGKKIKKG